MASPQKGSKSSSRQARTTAASERADKSPTSDSRGGYAAAPTLGAVLPRRTRDARRCHSNAESSVHYSALSPMLTGAEAPWGRPQVPDALPRKEKTPGDAQ